MKQTLTAMTAVTLILFSAHGLAAQDPASVERTLEEEVARLNLTLKQIVSLLQRQVESQDTELLIKRFELSGRSLIPKKEQLQKAKSSARNLEDEETSLVPMIEILEKEASKQAGTEDADPYQSMQREQMELRIETLQQRKRELAREIMELENDVAVQEEDLRILEEAIDSRLGLR